MTETKQAPYDYNTATLPAEETQNARNYWGEKELVNFHQLIAYDSKREKGEYHDDRMVEAVTVRYWMGKSSQASVVYCSIWVRTRDGRSFAGKGTAGGWGYHKESAALDEAIRSAGIKLKQPIHGCGESASLKALGAIARAAGYGRCPQTIV